MGISASNSTVPVNQNLEPRIQNPEPQNQNQYCGPENKEYLLKSLNKK